MLLFDQLAVRARAGGPTALRWRTAEGWRHYGWAELEAAIAELAFRLEIEAGSVAASGGDPLLALAILARGARLGAGPTPVQVRTGRPPPGWLVGQRKDLRATDPACGEWTHGDLMVWAEQVGAEVEGPVLLVSPDAPLLGALLLAIQTGHTLVIDAGDPETQRATTWMPTPARLRALAPRGSRLGAAGAILRGLGRVPAWAGPALRVILCDAPELSAALQSRGVSLRSPPEAPCASLT